MYGRTRTRSLGSPVGTRTYTYNNSIVSASYQADNSTCTDICGNPNGDNPFDLSSTRREGGLVTGTTTVFGIPYIYKGFPCLPARTGYLPPNIGSPPSSSFKDINSVLARHHPGEPSVALPVFVYELKDLPDMLQHAFKRAKELSRAAKSGSHKGVLRYLRGGKRPAEDWLNYNFGWAPLISDLSDIAGLTDDVAKRAKRIRSAKRNLIRRRSSLGSWGSNVTSTQALPSTATLYYNDFPNIPGVMNATVTHEKWVSSVWTVSQEMFEAAHNPRSSELYKAALGLDISITHAYDAMPWSWLLDWFTGIGDIIHANQNRFGIGFKSACLMHHTKSSAVITPTAPRSGLSTPPFTVIQETKTRSLVAPSLANLGINILSPRQLTTLASLKVARRG